MWHLVEEERLAKALLARELDQLIRARGLTQRATALILGIDQPKVPHVLRGRLAELSTQRLPSSLTSLGQDADILVRPAPRPRRRGRLRVLAA